MASQTLIPKLTLPVINFNKELKPGTSLWLATCDYVRHALEEYGCFLAQYHKLSTDLNSEVFAAAKELHDLPTETKCKNISDKPYYGYLGQLPHLPIHESLGIENPTTFDGVQRFSELMWSSGNYKFCEAVVAYSRLMAELEQLVDKMVFESYGVQKQYESHIGSTTYLLRMIKYRPPKINECDIGAKVHTDKSFLTILCQNQVNGLRVQARNGEWIDVDFSPQSCVVLAGDAYLAWSNDRIHSPRHEVILREKKLLARYSLALLAYNTGITEIPEELVDDEHPLQFRPFDNFGLLGSYINFPTRLSESTARSYCGISSI